MADRGIAHNVHDLLRGFFLQIPGTETSPEDYFARTFVTPAEFDVLLERMSPTSPPRLVIWDGQSRIGKTWSAIGALVALLEAGRVDSVWTSGEDSHLIFAPYNGSRGLTLADGFKDLAKRVKDAIAKHVLHGRIVILLDDFVGTARLRAMPRARRDLDVLASYFASAPEENPLLRLLVDLPGATVVITGRSSVVTSARVRVGIAQHTAERVSHGIFQTVGGDFIGTITAPWLTSVIQRHSAFIADHPEFLLPPVAAFASEAPPELTAEPQLPRILFGADLAEFADEIEAAETLPLDHDTLARLDDLYLLYVAPALMYPERATDPWLWSSPAAQMRHALYLHPGVEGLHLRIPNKYYLRAVAMHLQDASRLGVLARVLNRKISTFSNHERMRAILVRGFTERILDWNEPLPKTLAADIRPLFAVGADDPLLQWEQEAVVGHRPRRHVDAETALSHPGLASAIGWATIKFRGLRNRAAELAFVKDIAKCVEKAKTSDHNPIMGAGSSVMAVSYSNLLRWFTHDIDKHGHPRTIDSLSRNATAETSCRKLPPREGDYFDMVFEDAIMWADHLPIGGSTRVNVERVHAAKRLRKALRRELDADSPLPAVDDFAGWQLVNRLFSLLWHNDWMDDASSYFNDVASAWVQKFTGTGVALIAAQPELLSVNLQYHWFHMLAQWAVWTRDWCFASDTPAFERSRPLSCSPQAAANRPVQELLSAMLEGAESASDIRNAFFLLGSRCAVLDDMQPVVTLVSRVNDQPRSACETQGYLQAIYELARQGFLDRLAPEIMGERPSVHATNYNSHFREACRRLFQRHHTPELWDAYQKELNEMTYLDLIPAASKDIMPPDWLPERTEHGRA